MTNNKKGKKKTAAQLAKQKQRRLAIRLEKPFEISGLYITRSNLEILGYDTSHVNDATMRELASDLGDACDWDADCAIDIAEQLNIPKRSEKPAA